MDPLDGEIAELLVYDRVLDASEISSVRSDLAQTYGLSIPTRTDTDGDGFVDPCDQGLTYLNAPEISVTLASPPALSGGTVANAIDAAGFTGRRASPVPALGGAARAVLAMACAALLARARLAGRACRRSARPGPLL